MFPTSHSLNELEVNIRREIAALGPAVSQKSIYDVRSWAPKCLAAKGGHLE